MRARIFSGASRLVGVLSSEQFAWLLTAVLFSAISVYSLWYTSAGLFPKFPQVGNMYTDLSEALQQGQISLLEKPDPRLVALPNPYDLRQLETIPYHWDASYYAGKYYLYWGPVPAVIMALYGVITQLHPPDQLVVLFSYLGIAAIIILLLFQLRKKFYPRVPAISIFFFVLVACLNMPFAFLLGRPQVYETSIINGQFFLLLGLFAWLQYLFSDKRPWLILAGLSWGLAVSARYNLVLSVSIYLGCVLFWFLRSSGMTRSTYQKILLILTPLVVCALSLGLYNFLRFGNPFETGRSYQLTVPAFQNRYYSISFVPSSVYMYMLYPLTTRDTFPFFRSDLVQMDTLPFWAALPKGKLLDEVFSGFLPSIPLFWTAIITLPFTVWGWFKRLKIQHIPDRYGHSISLPTIVTMLGLGGLVQFLYLLFFYYNAMRYGADFFLTALLLVAISIWSMDNYLRPYAGWRIVFWLFVAVLTVWSAGIGFFAGFDIPPQIFRHANPELYQSIADWWNRVYHQGFDLINIPGFINAVVQALFR